jgi:hypothetical protein
MVIGEVWRRVTESGRRAHCSWYAATRNGRFKALVDTTTNQNIVSRLSKIINVRFTSASMGTTLTPCPTRH